MSTRTVVLSALREAGGTGISGEALAHELGVSRVAVGKHVSALRELGYTIDAEAGRGYRLLAAPDLALPEEVAPLVTAPLWTHFTGGPETGSTNADARALAQDGAAEGTVVVAARQTAGRGRLGRTWSSPTGGAYVSVVLRPNVAPANVGSLALVVGLGIARGLETLGACPRLKWPNDLLLDTPGAAAGKLAGILLEMSAEADRVEWVVAGFGINVAREDESSARIFDATHAGARPAYLRDVTPGVRVAEAAAAALDGVAAAYASWLADGFDALRGEYQRRFALADRDVTVRDAMGVVRASGTCEGIDAEGRLLVREAGGVTAVSAGEVTLR